MVGKATLNFLNVEPARNGTPKSCMVFSKASGRNQECGEHEMDIHFVVGSHHAADDLSCDLNQLLAAGTNKTERFCILTLSAICVWNH